jgi:hypothetical protein
MKEKLSTLLIVKSFIGYIVTLLSAVAFLFFLKGCGSEQISEHEIVPTSSTSCWFCMCPEGQNEYGRWGSPEKIDLFHKPVSENEKYVSFGLITDTHIDAMTCKDGLTLCGDGYYCNNSEHMRNTRKVIKDLNLDCKPSGAPHVEYDSLGIIHLGDITNDHDVNTQQILAFRQFFEYNYSNNGVYTWDCDCGTRCNDAYSLGTRINDIPVIPMLGNHDVAKNSQNETSRTVGYIIQQMENANGLLAQYPSHAPTNFIWRWGQYVFVTLGLHASSRNWEAINETDIDKIEWLKTSLEQIVGDKNLGVLIFQHYGWDGFSASWWTDEQKNLLLDVLNPCRVDTSKTVKPYNVIGIFTGHNHHQHWYSVPAGKDAYGNDVVFENFSMIPAGITDKSTDCNGCYGFSIVRLTPDKMYIHTKNEASGVYWDVTERDISVGN